MKTVIPLLMAVMIGLSACSGASDTDNTPSNDQEASKQNDQQASADAESNEDEEKQDGDKESKDEKKKNQQQDDQDQNGKGDGKKGEEATFEQKPPKYKMTDNFYIKPIDDSDPKVVLLTIDDAPEEHAVEMAKTLKRLDAKAIFYINKIYVDKDNGKEKLKKLHKMGFPLGNHTVSHPNLSDLSKKEQRDELVPVYDQIKKVTGEPVKFFRAPHGVNTALSDKLAKQRDVLVMNWSYGYDFKAGYQDADKLTDIMLDPDPSGLLRDGAILLMHDRDWTNKALADIVKGLRDKGYKILDPALLKTPQSPES